MRCFHPHCPMQTPGSTAGWAEVVEVPEMGVRIGQKAALRTALNRRFNVAPSDPPVARKPPTTNRALMRRLLALCPCLYNQIDAPPTPRAIIHFCEMAIKAPITSSNVHNAFLAQHPRAPKFSPSPIQSCSDGGTVMEMLCSEVLNSHGIPEMKMDIDDWPVWTMPGHVLMNQGRMNALRALGDIMIPCAPTNLVISVKSEAARERLLYSANSIEGIGFGFFNQPSEFWTVSRMSLFKRMGFSAIYMPDGTHKQIVDHLKIAETERHAVNINGSSLYRPLTQFGGDMRRVIGRSSMLL
jgi:hypothetical protein